MLIYNVEVKADINNLICETDVEVGNDLSAVRDFKLYDGAAFDYFNGSYTYIPMVTSQTIECKKKTMKNDVLIKPISTKETNNASGGTTFEIFSGVLPPE